MSLSKTRVNIYCIKCGLTKSVQISHRKQKYCSQDCYHNVPISKETKNLQSIKNKERKAIPPHYKGESHYRWIKDRTKIKQYWTERSNPEYKQWRKRVYERDSLKCKMHNSDCHGKIYAHHILGWTAFPELRYEVDNGITLCHFHHPRKRADEARLSPYFQEIIRNIKY